MIRDLTLEPMRNKNRGNKPRKRMDERITPYTPILYSITINQVALIQNQWWELDIIDVAIYNAIKSLVLSGRLETLKDKKAILWYRIPEYLIIEHIPIIGISSNTAIYKRVQKLIKYEILAQKQRGSNRKYLKLGVNSRKIDEFFLNSTSISNY